MSRLKMIAVKNDPLIIASCIGVGVSLLSLFYLYKLTKSTKHWKLVGHLSQINFFPVKSCSAIFINQAECNILGLKNGNLNDRTFMLTDENGNYQTGRAVSKLVKIKPFIKNDNVLTLRSDNLPDFDLNLAELKDSKSFVKCKIWNDILKVVDCGDKAAKWVSKAVLKKDSGLKLVYYPHQKSSRSVRKKFTVDDKLNKKDCGAFADGSSYMMASDSSLNELNSRLPVQKVEIHQFRPNFVVKGSIAYDEDNWKMIKIGNKAEFEVVLPCNRCNFINVDPYTGESNDEGPLKTLKKYRQFDNKEMRKLIGDSPKMGLQMALIRQGKVKVGDPIFAVY